MPIKVIIIIIIEITIIMVIIIIIIIRAVQISLPNKNNKTCDNFFKETKFY